MQDLSSTSGGWTHTDAGNTVTESKYRVRSELTDNETASTYHYKSVSVTGNFTHYVTFGIDTTSGTSQWAIWAVSDTVGDLETLMANTSAHTLAVYVLATTTDMDIYIGERDGSGYVNRTVTQDIDEAYRYMPLYAKIDRTSTTFTVTIYREPSMENVIYTLTKTLNSAQTYSYLFMGMNGGYIAAIPETLTTLINSPTPGTATNIGANYVWMKQFTATATGTMTHFRLYANNSGNVKVSIYADSSNSPGTRLGKKDASTAVVTGWNNIALESSVSITSGTKYWLAALSDDSDATTYVANTGLLTKYKSVTYSTWTWPDPITGLSSDTTVDAYYRGVNIVAEIPAIGQSGSISAFSAELWIDETPIPIFDELISVPLIYAENDKDDFNGFPTSDESWTVGGDAGSTIAESSAWSSDGDGKSVLITGVDGDDDDYAYFTTSNSATWNGGVINADVKITALGTNAITELFSTWSTSTSTGCIAYVQDVNDTQYFRVAKYDNSAYTWSSATNIIASLDTSYNVTLVDNPYTERCTLVVNGRLADKVTLGADHIAINRVYIGYLSGGDAYKGGTRYIDNLKFMNGLAYFPSIARGGNGFNTLVATVKQDHTHGGVVNNKLHAFYSTDNGATWNWFYTYSDVSELVGQAAVRWCAARGSWYIFIDRFYSDLSHTSVYECTPDGSGTYLESDDCALITNFSNEAIRMWPTRELNADGKLYVGIEIWPSSAPYTSSNQYVQSALFNWSDGVLSNRYKYAAYDDIVTCTGSHCFVAEPTLFKKNDGTLCSTLRYTNSDGQDNRFRFKCSSDDGTSTWTSATLYDPGEDWNHLNAMPRAFMFRGYSWWQFRDNQNNTDPPRSWVTNIVKAEKDPDTNNKMNIISEMWWESNGEGGNGDIDAISTAGQIYLDLITDMFGTTFFKRLYTGEIGRYTRMGFTNFQDPGVN